MTNPKYPRKPAKILTTAFKMAMAITLVLARDRATGKSRPLYFGQGKRIVGMAKIWDKAKSKYRLSIHDFHPDASILLKVEHSIRRSFSRILLKTSVRYGNTETRRLKREEGEKEYLNILWDYAGSRIRDVVKSRFFFPKAVLIEKSDGKPVIGYPGSPKTPIYPVRHNHLPELDFGDMIRSPLMELVRQCLKYGVPNKAAKKYIDDLLFRLIPFMDYVYTERRSGRPNYVRDGLKELRAVVDLIKREYGTRNGQRQSITREVQESVPFEEIMDEGVPLTDSEESPRSDHADDAKSVQEEKSPVKETHFIEEAIAAANNEGAVVDEFVEAAQTLVDNKILTSEDSIELLKQAKEQSRRIGSQLHKFVEKNFQSPFTLSGIVYHGTQMAYDDSGLMLFSEVSIAGGKGRVDFILARAKQLPRVDGAPSPIVCESILVADLKTKSAFDFDIYGMESRSKSVENVVGEFVLERRALTDQEWKMVLSNTPIPYEREQINAYETAITSDYENVMWKDVDCQKNLTKAVIVVDSFQKWKDISEEILPLILRAYNGCVDGTLSKGDFLLPSDDASLKIAIKMLSVVESTTDTVSLDAPLLLRPFIKRVQDEKEFILYLTVPGSGSPAQSAAVIAERWHGLEYVYNLARKRHRDVHWLDLTGEYTDPILRKYQFRLSYQTDPIKRFFKQRVQVKDLSHPIRDCLHKGGTVSTLRAEIQEILEESRNPIIVVSGWENLRRSTPDSMKRHLDEIATTIMQSLPYRCSILWFARPVPIAQNSTTYSARCVAPFYLGTIWQNFVDTIVWNVVMPPDRTGARYPTNDHERGIFIERPEIPMKRKIIEIEPLRGWGEDFRSGGRKKQEIFHKGLGQVTGQNIVYVEEQLGKCIELIPHLLLQNQYNPRPKSNDSFPFEQIPSVDYPPQNLKPMLSFRPTQIYALEEDSQDFYDNDAPKIEVDGRIKLLQPIEKINRVREYRKMDLAVTPPIRSTRPPSESYLQAKEIDDYKIVLREILNLKDSIAFLKQASSIHLLPLYEELSKIIDDVHRDSDDRNTATLMTKLRLVLTTLKKNTLSKDVWKRLSYTRSIIPRDLNKTQERYITSLQKRNPDILLLTGNHLFLILLAALDQFPDTPFTKTLHSLWDYVRPWHLTGLGFRPEYPKNHNRGRSVLDRHRLLQRLRQRITDKQRTLDLQSSLTNIKFGQLIALPHIAPDGSSYFWLLFQQKPGLFDVHTALLKSKWIDPRISPIKVLREMASDKTYWSDSDLVALSKNAKLKENLRRIPVMIADQQGLQVLWVGDDEVQRWVPIGQVHYSTRRYEDVTFVRTITLTADPHLHAIDYDDVRKPIHQPKDMVEKALFIIHTELSGCVPARCEVSLDSEEKMYRVSFTEQKDSTELGELLINRTADLLEILRRPDNDCEPVIVDGNRLIWNRFNDISYDGDVSVVRSWVNSWNPFPGMALKLPPSASDLLDAHKEFDITLEVYHDSWTCPMRGLSLEEIQESHEEAKKLGPLYRHKYDRPWGEPERISNESGVGHGSCWRVLVQTPQSLTPELRELQEVRFTDSQATFLLSSQELVYQSRESKEWITHTFKIEAKNESIKEICESWRLRTMINKATGKKLEPSWVGVSLQAPDQWIPYFTINPDNIVIGLREKGTWRKEEQKLLETNVALRPASEVRNLLDSEMEKLVERCGIDADRRLRGAIRTEIKDALGIYYVEEDGAEVELNSVTIREDSVGGRVIYVILLLDGEYHEVPVTRHLHDYRGFRIDKDEFVNEVESVLDKFNLSEEGKEEAVKKVMRIMKREKLIK